MLPAEEGVKSRAVAVAARRLAGGEIVCVHTHEESIWFVSDASYSWLAIFAGGWECCACCGGDSNSQWDDAVAEGLAAKRRNSLAVGVSPRARLIELFEPRSGDIESESMSPLRGF